MGKNGCNVPFFPCFFLRGYLCGFNRLGECVEHPVIPTSAVRDEGVSYHYLPPSREVECCPEVVARMEEEFMKSGIEYVTGKTWTTDSFYRETEQKIELRKAEGCLTVEMEAAAFFAVAKFRGVKLGYILYGGDDLSGVAWDSRKWHSRGDVRRNLVDISIRTCLALG